MLVFYISSNEYIDNRSLPTANILVLGLKPIDRTGLPVYLEYNTLYTRSSIILILPY
jgi:hypothetical protein